MNRRRCQRANSCGIRTARKRSIVCDGIRGDTAGQPGYGSRNRCQLLGNQYVHLLRRQTTGCARVRTTGIGKSRNICRRHDLIFPAPIMTVNAIGRSTRSAIVVADCSLFATILVVARKSNRTTAP